MKHKLPFTHVQPWKFTHAIYLYGDRLKNVYTTFSMFNVNHHWGMTIESQPKEINYWLTTTSLRFSFHLKAMWGLGRIPTLSQLYPNSSWGLCMLQRCINSTEAKQRSNQTSATFTSWALVVTILSRVVQRSRGAGIRGHMVQSYKRPFSASPQWLRERTGEEGSGFSHLHLLFYPCHQLQGFPTPTCQEAEGHYWASININPTPLSKVRL